MTEIYTTVWRNHKPKVTPTNWEAFEVNRNARFNLENDKPHKSFGFLQFVQRTNELIERGRNKKYTRRSKNSN